ncbi:DUF4255 domain-containing protein [Nodosilinea sp. P-1105]|nr:DUF4255 domain-containing protein [Nodosilinea sp. P-1105]
MSNALAIAAVTTTLRDLISRGADNELGTGSVTTRPLDLARENGNTGNQINLFLYHTQPSAAWRNRDLPSRVKPGETGAPPLALNLYYLVTAYGQNNDDILGHRLLGLAMQTLHDNTTLQPADLRLALADSDLHSQVERIHITPITLNLEEMSKLWATFQTQYRISAAYEASVVLIDSRRSTKTPLPVLSRGSRLPSGDDQGVAVQPAATPPIPPFPALERLVLPFRQPSIRLGETLVLEGYQFDQLSEAAVTVQFRHPRWPDPIELSASGPVTATQIPVVLDPEQSGWLAGTYSVATSFVSPSSTQITNALPVSLAPRLVFDDSDITPQPDGGYRLTVRCSPGVWLWQHPDQPKQPRGQSVALLVGDREFLPLVSALPEMETDTSEAVTDDTSQETETDASRSNLSPAPITELTFDLQNLSPGRYWLRLRVDGVDSLVVDWQADPPVFDETQQLMLVE